MDLSRRSLVLGASALTTAAALSSCRATEESAESPAASTSGGSAAAATGFPVTIPHKFGSTTITAPPKRVVCVGLVEQDMLLALGIVPVAVSAWLAGEKTEIYPWAKSYLRGAKTPVVLPTTDGVPVEKIAALKPDLIIGQYAGVTAAEYARLSQIAPTVAQPKQYVDYGVPWEVNARNVALAVGKKAAGERVIGNALGALAAAKKANPQFAGKSAIVLTSYEGIYVYGPEDPRSRILEALGFVYPAKFRGVGGGKEFGESISGERAKELDFDAVVWLASPADVTKGTGGLWAQTKAQSQGRSIYVPSDKKTPNSLAGSYASSFSFLTPLSIPYLLRSYVPQLVAAVDGNPKTAIPGPKG